MRIDFSLFLFIAGVVYCVWRGAKQKRWAEGLFVGSIFGIFGLPIAYFFWQDSHNKSPIRTSPRNWSSWAGREISLGCAMMGIAILFGRVYPYTRFRPLPPEHIAVLLVAMGLFGVGMVLKGIWEADAKKRPVTPPQCTNCDYNLTGNVSGVCPECGADLSEEKTNDY